MGASEVNSQMAELKEMVDNARVQATLVASVDTLSENVKRLTATVDENNKQLARLSVLEAQHNNQTASIERAFDSIKSVRADVDDAAERNEADHKRYDRYVWTCIGFGAAVSLLWSVLGYRMMDSIDEANAAISRMQLHMQQDKVISEQDVRNAAPGASK